MIVRLKKRKKEKTLSKKNVRKATPGAPISIEDANPKLAARLRGYEAMAGGRGGKGGAGISFSDTAFHRPGSHKK